MIKKIIYSLHLVQNNDIKDFFLKNKYVILIKIESVFGDSMFFNLNKIIESVRSKNRILRLSVLGIGTFLLALAYNMYLKPYNIVTGGVTGFSIVLQKLTNIDANIFIYALNALLLILSLFTLGKKETSRQLLGTILYPLMITLTVPLASMLNSLLVIDNFLIKILLAGLLMGFASGIIYKVGYASGGNDIIVLIINKYFKVPIGKTTFFTNLIIIILGGTIFGINNVLYAIIIVYINGALVDKMLIGISNSKQFFIHTKEINKVRELIIEKLGTGVTVLETTGGYSRRKRKMLMCVVATKDYYLFKEAVLEIDPDAFFVINDCYEVSGGVKRSSLPFL